MSNNTATAAETPARVTLTTPPADCREMGLTPGTRYDRSRLTFAVWRNEAGELDRGAAEVAGYHESHYWDADGRYLGPDADGIAPAYDYAG